MRLMLLAVTLIGTAAQADTLVLPGAVERRGTIAGSYRIEPPRDGPGTLALEWSDALGRVVMRSIVPIDATDGMEVSFLLEASRAMVMTNTIRARLTRGGVESAAEAQFIARPPVLPWDDFQIIMYQEHAGRRLAGLRGLGVTGVKVLGHRVPFTAADVAARIVRPLAEDMRWYVENIATDFYAPYHMWTPEYPNQVNRRFVDVQERHRRDPSDMSVYERIPSLVDPVWQGRIRQRLADTVREHKAYRPFYYSLGDEPGIADLAAAWDFDRGPASLAEFRAWLRLPYPSLAALNAQWGSDFADWDAILPPTTTATMARIDHNYSAWNDFKAFMDESFAAALRMGTNAVHAADPAALAGIEGGQIPGWGGWNYSHLAHAVDVMEIYEAGENVEIARALNPDLVTITTSFATGAAERRRIWSSLLKGSHGLILWDENDDVMRDDGSPGLRGAAEGALYHELRTGLGALMIASPPVFDPVALLYSPASFRLSWLFQHRTQGDGWTGRDSEKENEDTPVRVAMRAAARDLTALGIQPRWLTPGLIATGALRRLGVRLLVLPLALVLSDAEAAEIDAFAAAGGMVLADGPAGIYDGHARLRAVPALAADTAQVLAEPIRRAIIADALAATRVRPVVDFPPAFAAGPPATLTVRRNGAITLLGLQGNGAGADATLHVLRLGAPAFVRDIRAGGVWTRTDRLELRLDGEGPSLFAIAPEPTPPPTIHGPARVSAGATAQLRLDVAATPAATTVLHVEVRDPVGRVMNLYSGNAMLRAGAYVWRLKLALNDPAGEWTITVRDVLGGGTAEWRLDVDPL